GPPFNTQNMGQPEGWLAQNLLRVSLYNKHASEPLPRRLVAVVLHTRLGEQLVGAVLSFTPWRLEEGFMDFLVIYFPNLRVGNGGNSLAESLDLGVYYAVILQLVEDLLHFF